MEDTNNWMEEQLMLHILNYQIQLFLLTLLINNTIILLLKKSLYGIN